MTDAALDLASMVEHLYDLDCDELRKLAHEATLIADDLDPEGATQ